jgi:hypothetical protein
LYYVILSIFFSAKVQKHSFQMNKKNPKTWLLITWFKNIYIQRTKIIVIINYEKKVIGAILKRRKKKKDRWRLSVYTAPLLEKTHRVSSNITVKHYMTKPKEVAHAVKTATRKANQTKHHEVSISCLYLIN